MIGPIIATLTALSVVSIVITAIISRKLKEEVWLDPHANWVEVRRVMRAIELTKAFLRERFPASPELCNFYVEIHDGQPQPGYDGVMEKQRTIFFLPAIWVVKISDSRDAPYLLAHEVLAHMVPQRLYGDANKRHDAQYLELENALKNRLREFAV